jgi:hypothetical protein
MTAGELLGNKPGEMRVIGCACDPTAAAKRDLDSLVRDPPARSNDPPGTESAGSSVREDCVADPDALDRTLTPIRHRD